MQGIDQVKIRSQKDLDIFNGQVLACQEEAFTLACSLLGDERWACELVQAVFLRVYTRRGDRGIPIPVQVLQGVIGMCRQAKPSQAFAGVEFIPGWRRLEWGEREALLLVDVLGKTYQETALVLDRSEREVAAAVASGRRKLARRTL
jgi:DNA-directed RNA polymerase specialized sigma24 family protein